ncbi:MAG: N-glycosylase/DNA lyase [Candidatus Methanomethylicia archaeon]
MGIIETLTRNLSYHVSQRVKEFKTLGKNGSVIFDFNPFIDLRIYSTLKLELAFCISVANSKALNGLLFQNSIMEWDLENREIVRKTLENSRIRFYNRKTEYIIKSIQKFNLINNILDKNTYTVREWLVENVKGLGYKEASHFLRNIGRDDVAIIDRHVLRYLHKNNYIDKIPGNLSRKTYLEIEKILEDIADENDLNLAELDLYIWYYETGKILK